MTSALAARLPTSARSGRSLVALGAGAAAVVAFTMALAAVAHTPETRISPLEPDTRVWRALLVVGIASAFAFYLAGIALLRQRPAPLGAVVVVAAALQLAPLFSPLLLSRDVYAYWDYARIAEAHGGNPYSQLPARWPDDPAYRLMGQDWRRAYDAYGPAWTLVAEGEARVAGSSARTFVRLSRLVGAASMLGLVGIAAWTAPRGRRAFAAAFVGWNPLLALHYAGGGHNDALMMVLVLLALGLTARRRELASGCSWTLAVAVKWLPLALLPLELVALRGHRRFRLLLGLGAGGVAATAIATAFFGTSWWRAAIPISNELQSSNSLSTVHWMTRLGLSERHSSELALVAFVILYGWLLAQAARGRPRRALAAGGLCIAAPWVTPWYATWPLSLASVEDDNLGQAVALGLSAWFLWDVLPI